MPKPFLNLYKVLPEVFYSDSFVSCEFHVTTKGGECLYKCLYVCTGCRELPESEATLEAGFFHHPSY